MGGSAAGHQTTSLMSHGTGQRGLVLPGGLEVSPATQTDVGLIR